MSIGPRLLILLAGVLAPAPAAYAAGENTPLNLHTAPTTQAGTTSGGGGLVRTIIGLAIVVGVIYGVAWLLRQMKASREERSHGEALATVATIPLGPNRAVHLIRAGSEHVLVGVTDHGVTPIRTYSADEARGAGLLPETTDDGRRTTGEGPTALSPSSVVRRPTLAERLRDWTTR